MTTRSYSIGVPLSITVHGNGRVEFDIDLSEIPLDEAHDHGSTEYDDDAVAADQAIVDTVAAALRHNITIGI